MKLKLIAVISITLILTTKSQKQKSIKGLYNYLLEAVLRAKTVIENFMDKVDEDIKNIFNPILKLFPSELDKDATFFKGTIEDFKKHLRLIVPGTRWCGDGDIAKSASDLGPLNETDKCCRSHDSCPMGITKDQTKYGLTNNGLFTRSHCDCDNEFRKCLKKVNHQFSKEIGFAYFTVLGPKCFKEDFPVINCNKKNWFRCVEYEFDKSGKKINQWFDNPIY